MKEQNEVQFIKQFSISSSEPYSSKKNSRKHKAIFPKQNISSFSHFQFQQDYRKPQKNEVFFPSTTNEFNFCGCENQIEVCSIFQEAFMKNIGFEEIKKAYQEMIETFEYSSLIEEKHQLRRKALFQFLPKNYPEFYQSGLKNLLNFIGDHLTTSQFSCLYSIHYHSKHQCLTYFLFQELQASQKNREKFIDNVKILMEKESLFTKCEATFHLFLSDSYNSAGANFVPTVYYSSFLKLFSRKKQTLKYLIILILKKIKAQFQYALCFIQKDQYSYFRSFLQGLNWPNLLVLLKEEN